MEDFLTAEPAVVIPKDDDEMMQHQSTILSMEVPEGNNYSNNIVSQPVDSISKSATMGRKSIMTRHNNLQNGATFRRSSTVISAAALNGVLQHRGSLFNKSMISDNNNNSTMRVEEDILSNSIERAETEHLLQNKQTYALTKSD
jgi:hypothetical protein